MKKVLTLVLAVLLVACIPLTAFAVVSPAPGTEPKVSVESDDPNHGTVKKEKRSDGKYEITAEPADNYEFDGWVFTPDSGYTFVAGDKKSPSIIVDITGDIDIVANFKLKANVAPPTGDYSVLFVLAAVITLAGAAYAYKKISA